MKSSNFNFTSIYGKIEDKIREYSASKWLIIAILYKSYACSTIAVYQKNIKIQTVYQRSQDAGLFP